MMLNGSANQLTSASGFLIFTLDRAYKFIPLRKTRFRKMRHFKAVRFQQAAGSKVPEDHIFWVAPRRYVS